MEYGKTEGIDGEALYLLLIFLYNRRGEKINDSKG